MAYQRVLEFLGTDLKHSRSGKSFFVADGEVEEKELVHFVRENYYEKVYPLDFHGRSFNQYRGAFLHGPFEKPPENYPDIDADKTYFRFARAHMLVPVGFRDFRRVSYVDFNESIVYSDAMLKHLEEVDHKIIQANRVHSLDRAQERFGAEITEDKVSIRGSFSRGNIVGELVYRKTHDFPKTIVRILGVGDLAEESLSELGLDGFAELYPHRIRDLVVHKKLREGFAITTNWEGKSLDDLLRSQDLIF
ncbi:MAG: hypothetical protein ACMXYL_04165 [Candidatus Woesearchaeota archaeon]